MRAERSLVVQGPPGTGKSQTIANIIATAVHDGKTVLFIAEKVVALEVVHKRLRDCKIDNVCLELHSRASNKRLLAEELARTLKRAESEPAVSDRSDRLKAIRDRLNTFARRLHTPIRNSGMTPFQTLGELAKARGRNLPPPQVHIPDLAEWDTQRFETAKTAAEMLSSIVKQSGPATSHPWRGVNNTLLQPLDLVRLSDDLVQFVNAAEDLSKLVAVGAEGVRHPKPDNLQDVDALRRDQSYQGVCRSYLCESGDCACQFRSGECELPPKGPKPAERLCCGQAWERFVHP